MTYINLFLLCASASNIETQLHSYLFEAMNAQPHEYYEDMTLTAQEKTPWRNGVMDKDNGSINRLNLMPVDREKSLSASKSSSFNFTAPSISFYEEAEGRIDRAVDNEDCFIDWLNPMAVEQTHFAYRIVF